MSPPEASDGWLAQLVYLGSIALAGLVAWLSQYRRGRREDKPRQTHAILEAAEIADMRAIRSIAPQLERIAQQLRQTFEVVADNHRIVEDNHRIVEQNREMLTILQRLQRSMDVEEEVKEHDRLRRIDELLKQNRRGSGET